MTSAHDTAQDFVTDYARALLDRNSQRIAELYAVPALIAFPQQVIAVSDAEQTRNFFDQGWEQYEGIDEVSPSVHVIAAAEHSIWADVTWSYGGQPRERFVYQLLRGRAGWQVGVLTPMALGE